MALLWIRVKSPLRQSARSTWRAFTTMSRLICIGSDARPARHPHDGSMTDSGAAAAKCVTLRVTMASPCTDAVAAINASIAASEPLDARA